MILCPECDCAQEEKAIGGFEICWYCGNPYSIKANKYFPAYGRKHETLLLAELFKLIGKPGYEKVRMPDKPPMP